MASRSDTKSHSNSNSLKLATGQRFSCLCCGQCCRRWHVALRPSDIDRLKNLDWSQDPDLRDKDPVMDINGHPFIAHRKNGDCLFLDPDSLLCKIHSRHGEAAKPLGCRVYPFNLATTFPGDVSVTLRMDCPAVQRNHGKTITEHTTQLQSFAKEMGLKGGFDHDDTSHLNPRSLQIIVDAAVTFAKRKDLSSPLTSLALITAIHRLDQLGETFLNDFETLDQVMPSFWERSVVLAQERKYRPVGRFSQAIIRQWLAAYLRRDEEMVNQSWSRRIRRTISLFEIMFNRSNLRTLGTEHPDIPLKTVNLFTTTRRRFYIPSEPDATDADTWEPYWRFLVSRLETLQFFGPTYYGAPFFMGFRALAMTYPLVLAAARVNAAKRNPDAIISIEDVQYGVGAIDHSFGRSKLIGSPVMRSIEIFFNRQRYGSLLTALSQPLS